MTQYAVQALCAPGTRGSPREFGAARQSGSLFDPFRRYLVSQGGMQVWNSVLQSVSAVQAVPTAP
jgi:hypothetical protein